MTDTELKLIYEEIVRQREDFASYLKFQKEQHEKTRALVKESTRYQGDLQNARMHWFAGYWIAAVLLIVADLIMFHAIMSAQIAGIYSIAVFLTNSVIVVVFVLKSNWHYIFYKGLKDGYPSQQT